MKVLFLAPLPPPISGHSLASKVFYTNLQKFHDVKLLNLSKKSFKQGINSLSRIFEVVEILYTVWTEKRNSDIIYITISESLAGNIKDLLTYCICHDKLDKIVIHLHGGSIRKLIFNKYPTIFSINKFFLRRVKAAIVLGESHRSIFSDYIPNEKIFVVPNFAEEDMFLTLEEVELKFNSTQLVVTFLSNLIEGKGYEDLLSACILLTGEERSLIQINFAGGFESEEDKMKFLEDIKTLRNVEYHGIVTGKNKTQLLARSHIFCLPTKLNEGQPISILEAYAAGCVVVTTNQGGICDIFTNGINGFEVKTNSPTSILAALQKALQQREKLRTIGMANRDYADAEFRISRYNKALSQILEN